MIHQLCIFHRGRSWSFRRWLKTTNSDNEKSLRLTCQFKLLRYIQQRGEREAYNKLVQLVGQHQPEFNAIIKSYTNILLKVTTLAENNTRIPHFLDNIYTNGKLDRAVLDILINNRVLSTLDETDEIHLRLLAPMCYILLKWTHSQLNPDISTVNLTFNNRTYDLFELVNVRDLPTLMKFQDLDDSSKEKFLLVFVNFSKLYAYCSII